VAINETATGNDSVAITGRASQGERTVGVVGQGDSVGVKGVGKGWHGVEGISDSTIGGHGVSGVAAGTGVAGVSKGWYGVYGETQAPATAGTAGVLGEGKAGGDGVKGHASGQGKAAVAGFHLTNDGPGIFGRGAPAGHFEGDVVVAGGQLKINGVVIDPGQLMAIASLTHRVVALETQMQRVATLEQQLAALQSQLNSVASNLQGRITLAEVAISSLQALAHSHQ
jgi:hypothetical protein